MAEIKKINSLEEYNDFVSNNVFSVVKVGASWCGPCRTLEQTIMELTPDEVEGIMLAEIDADDEWAEDVLAELNVRGIPVLIAFKNGTEQDRVQGGIGKSDLISFIERNR